MLSVSSQRLDVSSISSQNGAARFSQRDDECIYSRTDPGESTQLSRTSGSSLAHARLDDASLEKPVGVRIPAGIAVE